MPIIGMGDIASTLVGVDREDRIYFASGVSNSQETRESEYQREIDLLLAQDKNQHLVYFGSLSIFYSQTPYAFHKRFMEMTIKREFDRYTIIRMGNITWGSNPNTLINFIRSKIKNREAVEIKDVYRYIVEKDEFLHWISLIPPWPCELNITGRRMKVIDIVREYCWPWKKIGVAAEYSKELVCSSI